MLAGDLTALDLAVRFAFALTCVLDGIAALNVIAAPLRDLSSAS